MGWGGEKYKENAKKSQPGLHRRTHEENTQGKREYIPCYALANATRNPQETNCPGESFRKKNNAGKFSGKTQGTHGQPKETY